MTTQPRARKAPCPRCKSGFIIFEGTFDGESTCLNCGYHPPSVALVQPELVELADDPPPLLAEPRLAPEQPRRKAA